MFVISTAQIRNLLLFKETSCSTATSPQSPPAERMSALKESKIGTLLDVGAGCGRVTSMIQLASSILHLAPPTCDTFATVLNYIADL